MIDPIKNIRDEEALVVFSGGQDSTTCLFWAKRHFARVTALSFVYGQKHALEVELAEKIAMKAGVRFERMDIPFIAKLSRNSLTDPSIAMDKEKPAGTPPNTFVPGRNLFFLSIAAVFAQQHGIRHIVTGVSQTDFSGYPDCRDDSIKALQVAVNLGMDSRYTLHTPLMFLDKAATWRLAEELGGQPLVDVILEESHTCYEGERGRRFAWGYGCGVCPACLLRRRGYEAYMAEKQEKEPETPALREDV